jgi:hypothetical protein
VILFQSSQDKLENCIRTLQNIVIPKAQHLKSFLSQPLFANTIRLVVRVLTAIDLKNQLPTQARKIDDVWTDRHLPLELNANEAMGAQSIPQPTLGVGHVASQILRVTNAHPAPSPGALRAPPSPRWGEGNACRGFDQHSLSCGR